MRRTYTLTFIIYSMSDSVLRILYLVLQTTKEDTEVQRGKGTYPELYGLLRGRTGIQAADPRDWAIDPSLKPTTLSQCACPIHSLPDGGVALGWPNSLSLSILLL